jgi:hypothetical protein
MSGDRVTRREIGGLCVLLIASLGLRIGLALCLPPYQAPDERAHLRFVDHLIEQRRLPVQEIRDAREALAIWEESHQPPLAYVLYVPVALAARSLGAGEAARVGALRIQNALYGAATAALAFAALAWVTPRGDPRRWLSAAVVAFLPGFVGISSAVNNDGLACLLAAALWLPLLRPQMPGRDAWLGALLGLGCLAKLTVAPLIAAVLAEPLLRRQPLRRALRRAAVVGVALVALCGPWVARNLVLYGEPTGGGAGFLSFDAVAQVLPPGAVEEARQPDPAKAFLQFWGRFGIYNNLDWIGVQAVWLPLLAAALLGWLPRPRAEPDGLERQGALWLAALLLSVAGLLAVSVPYYGGWQGRYLYSALVPAAALLAGGWLRLLRGRLPAAATLLLILLLFALDAALVVKLEQFYREAGPLQWGMRRSL